MLSRFRNYLAQERFLIGASLLRIASGFIILYIYLIHYDQRHFLWTNSGVNIYTDNFKENIYSLYNLSDSLHYFDIIYHLGIIVTIFYLIGYKGRLFSILNYVFFYSIYVRMYHIGDGGDNLLTICLFFLLFANCTAYFSIDSYKYHSLQKKRKHTFLSQLSSIIHNFSVVFCIVQLCIVYFISASYQIMGEIWQNGTAIYYIAQVNEYSRPLLRFIVNNFPWAAILFTYASIIIKIAFPFTIMNAKLKPFMVGGIVFFHLGIGLGMGLLTFSSIMIAIELLVFTDEEYIKLKHYVHRFSRNIFLLSKRRRRKFGYRHFNFKR